MAAVKEGDVRIVEASRAEIRAFMDALPEDGGVGDKLMGELDEAQGEAEDEGKATYVVLKINGGPL